jgi:hypothetical protein
MDRSAGHRNKGCVLVAGCPDKVAEYDRRKSAAAHLARRVHESEYYEPTNHLDIAAREWLEASLSSRAAACVITSHDRALLIGIRYPHKFRVFESGYSGYSSRASAVRSAGLGRLRGV